MSEGEQNHYQVLRIERTADERAVKKAYFALVREFPPDSQPEEFKKIRAAYEVLSDPEARARYDAGDKDYLEYGPEVAARLREIEAQLKEDAGDGAVGALSAFIAEHPDVAIAREWLGHAHLRSGNLEEALVEWKALCKKAPDDARHRLFKAVTLHRLEKFGPAEKAIRKACRLDPKALRYRIALIDMLASRGRHDDAIGEVDACLADHQAQFESVLTLELRRIDSLACLGRTREADAAIDRLFTRMREQRDPELGRYVASQLAGTAAKMFARKSMDDANALLERCLEVHPESTVHHPFPERAEIDFRALPSAAQTWLSELKPDPFTIPEPIWPLPVFTFLAAVGTGLLGWMFMFRDGPWSAARSIQVLGTITITLLFGVFALRMIDKVIRSPLRAFTTLHTLYLIRARGTRLQVYPLFNLTNVSGTHHRTNGAYTHTQVVLTFGNQNVSVSIRNEQGSEAWMGSVLATRSRSLELLAEGFLEAEDGIDLVPPALLTDPNAAPVSRWGRTAPASRTGTGQLAPRREAIRWYGGAAAAALVLAVPASIVGARTAEDRAFAQALHQANGSGLVTYLAAHPTGRHAGAARAALEARREKIRGRLDAQAPGAAIVGALVGDARLVVALTVDAEGLVDAVPKPARASDSARIAGMLNQACRARGLGDWLEFRAGPDSGAAATLRLHGSARAAGTFNGFTPQAPPEPAAANASAKIGVAKNGAGKGESSPVTRDKATPAGAFPALAVAWKLALETSGDKRHEAAWQTEAPWGVRGGVLGASGAAIDHIVESVAERIAAEIGLGREIVIRREGALGLIGGKKQ
jgi:tetratricopeptide (TPR) repeat protein